MIFILFPVDELSGLVRNVSSDQVLPALLPGGRTSGMYVIWARFMCYSKSGGGVTGCM